MTPRGVITDLLLANRLHSMSQQNDQKNVFGTELLPCSTDPETGYLRDGCCHEHPADHGRHEICAVMTEEFLALSKYLGNDLSTPRPEFRFEGLKPGDRWCLCAARFLQAHDEGAAPQVYLAATHRATLDVVPLRVLREHALDDHATR